MLLIVSSVKLVAEIALLALAGQFLLGLLAGARRESNFNDWRLKMRAMSCLRLGRQPAAEAVFDAMQR